MRISFYNGLLAVALCCMYTSPASANSFVDTNADLDLDNFAELGADTQSEISLFGRKKEKQAKKGAPCKKMDPATKAAVDKARKEEQKKTLKVKTELNKLKDKIAKQDKKEKTKKENKIKKEKKQIKDLEEQVEAKKKADKAAKFAQGQAALAHLNQLQAQQQYAPMDMET